MKRLSFPTHYANVSKTRSAKAVVAEQALRSTDFSRAFAKPEKTQLKLLL
jgi:hypothetical protein